MMKSRTEEIWADLEQDKGNTQDILITRYSSKSAPDVYVGLTFPEKHRCLVFRISRDTSVKTITSLKLKEVSINLKADEHYPDKILLVFELKETLHQDIFSVLCEDLILTVIDINDEPELLKLLRKRLFQWQALFEKLEQNGLSVNKQQGLFGELYFLNALLGKIENNRYLIDIWTGNQGLPQDFIYHNFWGIEVKTTGESQEQLNISNEEQLNYTAYDKLYLAHISLSYNAGDTLNELVNEIRERLKKNPVSYHLFCQKLLNAGYFDLHKEHYDQRRYQVLNTTFYKVVQGFPAIIPDNLAQGISNVKYLLSLLHIAPYKINEESIIQTLKSYD